MSWTKVTSKVTIIIAIIVLATTIVLATIIMIVMLMLIVIFRNWRLEVRLGFREVFRNGLWIIIRLMKRWVQLIFRSAKLMVSRNVELGVRIKRIVGKQGYRRDRKMNWLVWLILHSVMGWEVYSSWRCPSTFQILIIEVNSFYIKLHQTIRNRMIHSSFKSSLRKCRIWWTRKSWNHNVSIVKYC